MISPGQGGIAQKIVALPWQVGEEADMDGLLYIDMLTEGAADEHLLHLVKGQAQAAGHDGDAGIDGRLGADEVILSTNEAEMQQYAAFFDFILNTIPTTHDLNPYIKLLKTDATLTVVGALEKVGPSIDGKLLIKRRRNIAGSYIGGLIETQEMLNFCAKHKIVSEIEVIPIQDVNKAFERLKRGDVKYRFVIDIESLQKR
mgnify:CR=1 FL=1